MNSTYKFNKNLFSGIRLSKCSDSKRTWYEIKVSPALSSEIGHDEFIINDEKLNLLFPQQKSLFNLVTRIKMRKLRNRISTLSQSIPEKFYQRTLDDKNGFLKEVNLILQDLFKQFPQKFNEWQTKTIKEYLKDPNTDIQDIITHPSPINCIIINSPIKFKPKK